MTAAMTAEKTSDRSTRKAAHSAETDMFTAAKLHAIYQIANVKLRTYPFPHVYVENILPPAFFAEAMRQLPADDGYTVLVDSGRVGKGYSRARLSLFPSDLDKSNCTTEQREFWRQMFTAFGDTEFATAIYNRFRPQIEQRFVGKAGTKLSVRHETFLMRDLETYSLGPHTDNPKKLVSVLFYLAADQTRPELGTSVYVPKDRDFTCPGGPHHDFHKFDHVYTMPYAPNALVAFPKSSSCFHGVEPLNRADSRRDIFFYDLKNDQL
jgi:hypothetical protein